MAEKGASEQPLMTPPQGNSLEEVALIFKEEATLQTDTTAAKPEAVVSQPVYAPPPALEKLHCPVSLLTLHIQCICLSSANFPNLSTW